MLGDERANSTCRMRQVQKRLDLERKSFLIVSDEIRALKKVIEMSENLQFQTLVVSDAEEALGTFVFHIPSAILLDLDSLGMSGEALLTFIQANAALSKVPVHVISNWKEKPQALHQIEILLEGKLQKILEGPAQRSNSEFQGKTVLLAIADLQTIFDLNNHLSGFEMNVLIARNPEDTLVQLEQNPEVDLVLMDFEMSPSEWNAVVRRIREHQRFAHLPIAVLVDSNERRAPVENAESPLSAPITKPLQDREIYKILKQILSEPLKQK